MTTQMERSGPYKEAPLVVRLEGPAVRHHRIPVDDIVLFASHLQKAVDRVARLLLGQSISVQLGRPPSKIKAVCPLEIAAMGQGSVTFGFDRSGERQATLFGDIGDQALIALVEGLEEVAGPSRLLPNSYDKGVLQAERAWGKLFDRGYDKFAFDLRTSAGKRQVEYTRKLHARIVERIQEPVKNRRETLGRLLMGDFKETNLRCRIHPPIGDPIVCIFDEAHKDTVLEALTYYVRVIGETTEDDGKILSLEIEDIEVVGWEVESDFEAPKDLQTLAAEQGLSAAADFNDLLGDFWPEEERVEDFIEVVRSWRREGMHSGDL